ncbi:MAG: hypothetical protein DRQ51_05665, partial [Gammaproteobacteria bacterium]
RNDRSVVILNLIQYPFPSSRHTELDSVSIYVTRPSMWLNGLEFLTAFAMTGFFVTAKHEVLWQSLKSDRASL